MDSVSALRVLVATFFHLVWKNDDRPLLEQDKIVLRQNGFSSDAIVPEANDVAEGMRMLMRLPEVQELAVPSLPRGEDEIEEFSLSVKRFLQDLNELLLQRWVGSSATLVIARESVIVERSAENRRARTEERPGFRVSIATNPDVLECVQERGSNITEVIERAVATFRKSLREQEKEFVQTQ